MRQQGCYQRTAGIFLLLFTAGAVEFYFFPAAKSAWGRNWLPKDFLPRNKMTAHRTDCRSILISKSVFHKDIWKKQLADALLYWVYIPAAVILSGKSIDYLFGWPAWPGVDAALYLAVPCLLIGAWLIWRSIRDLAVYGNGTPNPFRPPKRLVTEGSYSLCRHPMYLGYDLAALAVVLLFSSPAMLFISYPVFLIFEVRFLRKEEVILEKRFRSSFATYRASVPFLIPTGFIRRKRQP